MQDYKIIWSKRIDELSEKVKEYLKNGYKLSGGVAVDADDCLYQAVYKDMVYGIGSGNPIMPTECTCGSAGRYILSCPVHRLRTDIGKA